MNWLTLCYYGQMVNIAQCKSMSQCCTCYGQLDQPPSPPPPSPAGKTSSQPSSPHPFPLAFDPRSLTSDFYSPPPSSRAPFEILEILEKTFFKSFSELADTALNHFTSLSFRFPEHNSFDQLNLIILQCSQT